MAKKPKINALPPRPLPKEVPKQKGGGAMAGGKMPAKGVPAKPAAGKAAPGKPAPGTSSSTSTEVRSPTKTSTVADTKGNITVTGGAGDGDTIVHIGAKPQTTGALTNAGEKRKPSKVRSTTKNGKY